MEQFNQGDLPTVVKIAMSSLNSAGEIAEKYADIIKMVNNAAERQLRSIPSEDTIRQVSELRKMFEATEKELDALCHAVAEYK